MIQAHPRDGYSTIELMGVILVLTLLIGLVMPAIRVVQRASEKRRARAEATSLVQAVMHYRQEYGHWPLAFSFADPVSATNADSSIVAGVDPVSMPQWLSLQDKQAIPFQIDQWHLIDTLTNTATECNPRSILFFDPPTDSIDTAARFVDPWRQPYVVIMDPPPIVAGRIIGDLPAVAFSFGPPATGSKGLSNLVFSAEVDP